MATLMDIIKEAFDNDSTPIFALFICLWGTVFVEMWKRKAARLAYKWDTDNFELAEPDRPQFAENPKIEIRKDVITNQQYAYYPHEYRLMKFAASASMLIFMVCLVFVSVIGVILYRIVAIVDLCPGSSGAACFMLTTIISAVLNAVSILLLAKAYTFLAVKLTKWENHRTQTRYDDALIIKLFAFQFANYFASCFYIAFFRGRLDEEGMFGLGSSYRDECSGNCMAQLSFQVLVIMLTIPLPKLQSDVIMPFVKKLLRKRPASWCRCRIFNKVSDEERGSDDTDTPEARYIYREGQKPPLGDYPDKDFTLGEYTEKVIQYGFLMLFACAFPLAPLLALLTNLCDIRVDAKRLIWVYRRPVAFISQDIGTWRFILEFVNVAGVISNGFLIAFTSTWGRRYDTLSSKLLIVIGFEHIVFGIKFLIAYIIPDVPSDVRLAIRREKFQVARKLEEAANKPNFDYRSLVPTDPGNADDDSSGGNDMDLTYTVDQHHGPAYYDDRDTEQTNNDAYKPGPYQEAHNMLPTYSDQQNNLPDGYDPYGVQNRGQRDGYDPNTAPDQSNSAYPNGGTSQSYSILDPQPIGDDATEQTKAPKKRRKKKKKRKTESEIPPDAGIDGGAGTPELPEGLQDVNGDFANQRLRFQELD